MEIKWKELFGYHEINDPQGLEVFVKNGFRIVSCDASYHNKIGTCSIQISNGTKERKIKTKSFNARGPNEAEIISLIYGIKETKKIRPIKKTLFTNDNHQAINFVLENFNPKQENIKQAVNKAKKELESLNFPYEFALVRSKVNRKVDREAKRNLKKKENEIEIRIKDRIKKISSTIEKSKNLKYQFVDGKHTVKSEQSESWYTVDLESLSCSCPFWNQKWNNKSEIIKVTRALPCKHMCKVAEMTNKEIFQIFKTQIFKRR